jgi:hypothetical protein
VELCLKLNAVFTGVLFLAGVMMFTWSIVPSAVAAALGTLLVTVAASAEGNYALYDLYQRGRALSGVTDLNIDAMSAWAFGGLRIDSLARSMWYNPQHSLSCALGLMAMPVAMYAGVRASVQATVLAGIALAASTIFNPLIGGILSLIYGLIVIADAVVQPKYLSGIFRHAIAELESDGRTLRSGGHLGMDRVCANRAGRDPVRVAWAHTGARDIRPLDRAQEPLAVLAAGGRAPRRPGAVLPRNAVGRGFVHRISRGADPSGEPCAARGVVSGVAAFVAPVGTRSRCCRHPGVGTSDDGD